MRYREMVMLKRSFLLVLAILAVMSMKCGTVLADEIVCITCHGALPGKYGEPVTRVSSSEAARLYVL